MWIRRADSDLLKRSRTFTGALDNFVDADDLMRAWLEIGETGVETGEDPDHCGHPWVDLAVFDQRNLRFAYTGALVHVGHRHSLRLPEVS